MSNVTDNVVSNVVSCSICSDTHKDDTINLTCGHAFGRSCIKSWLEDSGKTNCFLCPKELTADEINKIIDRSLSERMVAISKKAFRVFSKASLLSAIYCAGLVAADSYFSPFFLGPDRYSNAHIVGVKKASLDVFKCMTIGAAATSLACGARENKVPRAANHVLPAVWSFTWLVGVTALMSGPLMLSAADHISPSTSALSEAVLGYSYALVGSAFAHGIDELEGLPSTAAAPGTLTARRS